jgi:hypothetical protein
MPTALCALHDAANLGSISKANFGSSRVAGEMGNESSGEAVGIGV